jgi:hypothetical protein
MEKAFDSRVVRDVSLETLLQLKSCRASHIPPSISDDDVNPVNHCFSNGNQETSWCRKARRVGVGRFQQSLQYNPMGSISS